MYTLLINMSMFALLMDVKSARLLNGFHGFKVQQTNKGSIGNSLDVVLVFTGKK